MFVARRMQKDPVTLPPSASLFEAQEKMRMRAIHQIPVVSEDRKLVGILSDRDIRAIVLPVGMIPGFTAEEAEKFLKNTPVEKVMKRKVIVATLADTLEDAIGLLYNYKINSLPVVDAEDKVVGIISRTNVLEAFIEVIGMDEISSRLDVVVPDKPGALAQVLSVISSFHVNVTSILTTGHLGPGKRTSYFRIGTLNVGPIRKALEEAGFEILDPSTFLQR
ncbi:MAG: CBS domain-containing protein [Deltaproteobacteria bacterium]|nr:CBS domain-containing protein [Deltaproteobacteria bacterium]